MADPTPIPDADGQPPGTGQQDSSAAHEQRPLEEHDEGHEAAMRMRARDTPATYAEIAAALGISRSTAYRWANPPALVADRLAKRERRQDQMVLQAERTYDRENRGKTCTRCGGPASKRQDMDALCRSVIRHQATAELVLTLLDRGVAPTEPALKAAEHPPAGKPWLFLRQLKAIGAIPAPVRPPLAHRTLVQTLVDADPADASSLSSPEREAAVVAAGCTLAAQERDRT